MPKLGNGSKGGFVHDLIIVISTVSKSMMILRQHIAKQNH